MMKSLCSDYDSPKHILFIITKSLYKSSEPLAQFLFYVSKNEL